MFLRSLKNGRPSFRWEADEPLEGAGPATGFPADATVLTEDGPRAAAVLAPGDRVWCLGDSFASVLTVERRTLRPEPLADPRCWPVWLGADALGDHVPERPLLLSPAQRICLGGRPAPSADLLVPVVALVNGSTIVQRPLTGPVPSVSLLLDSPGVLQVEGLLSEAAFRRRLFGIDRPRSGPSGYRAKWPLEFDR